MNTRLIISLLCAGALAFACGPRSHSEAPTALASALPLHSVASTATAATQPAPIEHARRRDGASGRRGDAQKIEKLDSRFNIDIAPRAVRFALDVKNVGGKHIELNFPNGQSYDFVVVDSVGREIWRWSAGRMFTQGMQNKQLGTGDAMRVSETWTRPARPGHYTAIATLKSSNFPVEERVDFVVQ
jgi:hypothetical protein